MLAAPQHGFVFLAMPKCGSTAIERELHPFASVHMRGIRFKHLPYAGFARHVQPMLRARGFPRTSYEVVCCFRDPIEWVWTWYRDRSRPALADPSHPQHELYAGAVTFDAFVAALVEDQAPARGLGSQVQFATRRQGGIGVDAIFRYDALDALAEHLSAKVGQRLRFERPAADPAGPPALDDATEAALRAHLAAEYDVYDRLTLPPRRSDASSRHERPASVESG